MALDHPISLTEGELAQIREVRRAVRAAVVSGEVIRLPDFQPGASRPSDAFALQHIGSEPNPFGGVVGELRFQFEGEEDLLHLFVSRRDDEPLAMEAAQGLVSILVPEVPPGLMWCKPGEFSHHFYFGHDVLLESESAD